MKVLGAAFVMLMNMRSSGAPRARCEERHAGTRSSGQDPRQSLSRSLMTPQREPTGDSSCFPAKRP
jgi:hypothetical protein